MGTVGLGPFPISAYGVADKDDYLVDNAYESYRGGYELGYGDTQASSPLIANSMHGRKTRLENTQEGLNIRSSHSAYWNEFEGFEYKNKEYGV